MADVSLQAYLYQTLLRTPTFRCTPTNFLCNINAIRMASIILSTITTLPLVQIKYIVKQVVKVAMAKKLRKS